MMHTAFFLRQQRKSLCNFRHIGGGALDVISHHRPRHRRNVGIKIKADPLQYPQPLYSLAARPSRHRPAARTRPGPCARSALPMPEQFAAPTPLPCASAPPASRHESHRCLPSPKRARALEQRAAFADLAAIENLLRPVDGVDDIQHGDLSRRPRQAEATAHAFGGGHQPARASLVKTLARYSCGTPCNSARSRTLESRSHRPRLPETAGNGCRIRRQHCKGTYQSPTSFVANDTRGVPARQNTSPLAAHPDHKVRLGGYLRSTFTSACLPSVSRRYSCIESSMACIQRVW